MSTFYATFDDTARARELVRTLLRSGVASDDLSLVLRAEDADGLPSDTLGTEDEGMIESVSSVGDATAFVGREDDPTPNDPFAADAPFAGYTSVYESNIGGGISTVEKGRNVDSVDQMDDSQSAAEDMISPPHEISQSEHEKDDIALTLQTGFPTPVPVIDNDLTDVEGPAQDQYEEGMDAITVPGFGTLIGGGALATAALDFMNPESVGISDSLVTHLRDEGVPRERAQTYQEAFEQGAALLAVAIVPGEISAGVVESLAERHGARNAETFDAPRFYEDGGKRSGVTV